MEPGIGSMIVTGHGDEFIFEGKYREAISLGSVTKAFVDGFKQYIRFHGLDSKICVGSSFDNNVSQEIQHSEGEVAYLGRTLFQIENMCHDENEEWQELKSSKVAFYNQQWMQYISDFGFFTIQRYTAYGIRGKKAVLIQCDSIEFLKGFYLASTYRRSLATDMNNQNSSRNTEILFVHNNDQLCHQYIRSNITIDYSNANKILHKMTNEYQRDYTLIHTDLRNCYHEIKNSLKDIICIDVIIITLEYALSKKCERNDRSGCNYIDNYNHCLTLCDFTNYGPHTFCGLCRSICGLNKGFEGHPFKIDIELVVAKDN